MNIMASKMLVVFAFIASFFVSLGNSMTTEITPDKATLGVTKTVTVSCFPDDVSGEAQTVESIQIDKEGAGLVALVRFCSKTDCTLTSSSEIRAVGEITGDISKSYLKATMTDPTANDTGVYTCSMHYLDASNLVKEDMAEKTLHVEEMTASDLEPLLKNLTDRLEALEANSSPAAGGSPPAVGKAVPAPYQQKPECYSGFAVLNNRDYNAKRNTILKLPDVIFSKGKGYDALTGVFTAPCSGIYNFNIAIALKGNQSGAIVQLKKNADVVLRLYAADKTYDDQSSGSIVLFLETGDSVFAYIEAVTGSKTFDRRGYTVFSGYLAMQME